MNIVDIIDKKRRGNILSNQEIEEVITGFMNGEVMDYQMSSLMMAILLKGMTDSEIISLTSAMMHSGEVIDLSNIKRVADKHSTGGVGDKTTMIVAPIVASIGGVIAKMSGRGLGHTGGTIDKLESIPGFTVKLTNEEFFQQIHDIGICVMSQTNNLVPADKKMYALRDVTGTVESIGLIASSIMSKKLASGANNLVIDVKVGNGALIKTMDDALKLANLFVKIGKSNGRKVVCLITNMDVPLGNYIGNALEVEEAIMVLKGELKGDLYLLCVELASYMGSLCLNISYEEAKERVIQSIEKGDAYAKFLEWIEYQHGDIHHLPQAKYKYLVKAKKSGYIHQIDALGLGKLSMSLGAGRQRLEEEIDYGAGIILRKKLGDYVEAGEVLMTLHTNKNIDMFDDYTIYFEINNDKKLDYKLIYQVIK